MARGDAEWRWCYEGSILKKDGILIATVGEVFLVLPASGGQQCPTGSFDFTSQIEYVSHKAFLHQTPCGSISPSKCPFQGI